MLRARKRVRVHLIDAPGGVTLPSVEGVLLGRMNGEVRLAVPQLLTTIGAEPQVLADARELVIPTSRVAFYEVLR